MRVHSARFCERCGGDLLLRQVEQRERQVCRHCGWVVYVDPKVAAGVILWLMDATINTMVLAGFVVAIGSVVDDAVIDVEAIVRRLREHRRAGSTKSTARIILEASLQVRPAILQATIIIVLAVLPIFFMGGLGGSFFAPLAMSFISSLG